ncbi:MAG: hypothetical protein ACPGXL_00120 [Chitinophagales bacterium]
MKQSMRHLQFLSLLILLLLSVTTYSQGFSMPAPVRHHFIDDEAIAQNLKTATQILDTLEKMEVITPTIIDKLCEQDQLFGAEHYDYDFFLNVNLDTTINFGFDLTFRTYFFSRGGISLSYLSYNNKVLVVQTTVELLENHYKNKELLHKFGKRYLKSITISDTLKTLLTQNKLEWQKKPQRIAYKQFFTANIDDYVQKEPIQIIGSQSCNFASTYLNTALEIKAFSLGNTRGLLEMEQLLEQGNTTCIQHLLYSPNPTVRLFAYHQYLELLKDGLVYDQATLTQMKRIASSQNDVLIGHGCGSTMSKNQEGIESIHNSIFRIEQKR